jgi:hypothetical protein
MPASIYWGTRRAWRSVPGCPHINCVRCYFERAQGR